MGCLCGAHFVAIERRRRRTNVLQARRMCLTGRAGRLNRFYRHQGAGVENPRLPQRCMRSRRRPGSPGGRQRSETSSVSPGPARHPVLGATLAPQILPPRFTSGGLPKIALSAAPGTFQHKVSCRRPQKTSVLGSDVSDKRARRRAAAASETAPRSTPPSGCPEQPLSLIHI